jgi:hypothetical protein
MHPTLGYELANVKMAACAIKPNLSTARAARGACRKPAGLNVTGARPADRQQPRLRAADPGQVPRRARVSGPGRLPGGAINYWGWSGRGARGHRCDRAGAGVRLWTALVLLGLDPTAARTAGRRAWPGAGLCIW